MDVSVSRMCVSLSCPAGVWGSHVDCTTWTYSDVGRCPDLLHRNGSAWDEPIQPHVRVARVNTETSGEAPSTEDAGPLQHERLHGPLPPPRSPEAWFWRMRRMSWAGAQLGKEGRAIEQVRGTCSAEPSPREWAESCDMQGRGGAGRRS